ncbi:S24 family peptidase [Rhodobacter capsulatus]|uniref:S24 family peptidase n=1 Tax=Rhodobacter capsulatus TaxID=1061 RepID=UPI0040266F26
MFFLDPQSDDNTPPEATREADLGARLAAVSDVVGIEALAEKTGKSTKQLKRYFHGAEPPFSVLRDVVAISGASYEWLASGRAVSDGDSRYVEAFYERELKALRNVDRTNLSAAAALDLGREIEAVTDLLSSNRKLMKLRDEQPVSKGNNVGAEHVTVQPIMDFNQPDFVRLPAYNDVHASAGPGMVPASEQADGVVAFTRRFLANQGARPDHCSVIWARGTSMKPTIPDGALLVVDHSQREVENGCIYVFNVSDRLLVKRARWRLDGRLELVSDNTDEGYPVETFGADSVDQLRVVGRVVYFGRTP